jgi:histidinol-phosphate phosphatase family protein
VRKVVFFDRDDTIIEDRIYLNDPDDIHFLPHVFECFRKLRDAGFDFVIATNQSGVPRGKVLLKNLHEIHRRIKNEFNRNGIDILDILYAPFMTDSNHPMRKPNPGMLIEAKRLYHIDLSKSWMVGDRMIDVEAGHRAGAKSILIGSKEPPHLYPFQPPEFQVKNLKEVYEVILGRSLSL